MYIELVLRSPSGRTHESLAAEWALSPSLAHALQSLGFNITFILPFKRDDLWKELMGDRMVGSEAEDEISYTIIRPGDDDDNPVRPCDACRPASRARRVRWGCGALVRRAPRLARARALACCARVALSLTAPRLVTTLQVSVGCVREAKYGSPVHGFTVSELLELKAPSYVKWATLLQADTVIEYVGRSDETPPSMAIALKEQKRSKAHPEGGTMITIKYDYSEVRRRGRGREGAAMRGVRASGRRVRSEEEEEGAAGPAAPCRAVSELSASRECPATGGAPARPTRRCSSRSPSETIGRRRRWRCTGSSAACRASRQITSKCG